VSIDLTGMSVVDAHCHGVRLADLLEQPPTGWADRITLIGMCMASSATAAAELKQQVSALTEWTMFASTGRRWLAHWLGVDESDVDEARMARLRDDAGAYLGALMADQRITDLFVDDGYPQPPVDAAQFGALVGATAHRVARIEPIIDRVCAQADTLDDAVAAFEAELDACGQDPSCIAYKSIIAYRSGLDVGDPCDDEVAASFSAWKANGLVGGRRETKALRDRFLHITCRKAATHDKAVHIHSGAGDPDVLLAHAHAAGLAPLIAAHPATAIVLIHAGFPWIEEAAYLAGMYPNAHIELSLFNPWATLDLDRGLRTILGLVPTSKVMYGSDEASEPEVLWISARLFRRVLARVLDGAVDDDLLTPAEGVRTGEGILGANALRLHGLAAT